MSRNTSEEKYSIKMLLNALPGILLVTVWPCLVHLTRIRTHLEDQTWYPDLEWTDDYFMAVRSRTFLTLAVFMTAVLVLHALRTRQTWSARKKAGSHPEKNHEERSSVFRVERFALSCTFLWLFWAFLSSVLSRYRAFSFRGTPDSGETVFVLMAYGITFLYGGTILRDNSLRRLTDRALISGAFLQSLIGVSQMAGHDFWSSGAGRFLILLGSGRDAASLEFSAQGDAVHKVYMSFYNPNFAAVYILIVLPFVIEAVMQTTASLRKTRGRKCSIRLIMEWILDSVTLVLLLLCLHGTASKAGRVLILVLFPVFYLLSSRLPGKKKVLTGVILAGILAALMGGGLASGKSNLAKGLKRRIFPHKRTGILRDMKVDANSVLLKIDQMKVRVIVVPQGGQFTFGVINDDTGEPFHMKVRRRNGRMVPADPNWTIPKCIAVEAVSLKDPFKNEAADLIIWYRRAIPLHFAVAEDGELTFVNAQGKADDAVNAPQIWADSNDALFTGRMFLWKRTLALTPGLLFLGFGQENFPFHFPQNDYCGRARANLSMYSQVLIRPHSMYLQILCGAGLPGLVFFVLAAVLTLVSGCRRLRERRKKDRAADRETDRPAGAALLAMLAFLALGTVYDSVVVVTPLMCLTAGRIIFGEKE